MAIRFHAHAVTRLMERGATRAEVRATIEKGEPFAAKYNRTRFRRSFPVDPAWRGRGFVVKYVDAYAIEEGDDWLVSTVVVKYSTVKERDR